MISDCDDVLFAQLSDEIVLCVDVLRPIAELLILDKSFGTLIVSENRHLSLDLDVEVLCHSL